MSAIGGPTAMMIDIAQVQPGFELQTLVPATALVMLTLGGFGLRNEMTLTSTLTRVYTTPSTKNGTC